jgi:hypothetical protein
MGMNFSLTLKEHTLRVSANRMLRKTYFELREMNWKKAGEDCIRRSYRTCTLHQIILR